MRRLAASQGSQNVKNECFARILGTIRLEDNLPNPSVRYWFCWPPSPTVLHRPKG